MHGGAGAAPLTPTLTLTPTPTPTPTPTLNQVPAPHLQPGAVAISTDAAPGASASLTYYDESQLPQLSAVLPRSSRAAEATLLRVLGSNFAPLGATLKCGFGSDGLSQASFVSPTELSCRSPASTATTHSVALAVTLDGYSFSGDGAAEEDLTLTPPLTLTPNPIPNQAPSRRRPSSSPPPTVGGLGYLVITPTCPNPNPHPNPKPRPKPKPNPTPKQAARPRRSPRSLRSSAPSRRAPLF